MKIAITGCIACGKTTFSKFLAENTGFKLINADDIVKSLYLKPEIIKQVQKIFKNKILTNNSNTSTEKSPKIDKEKLRELIFKNSQKKKELEKFIHPLVEKEIKKELLINKNIIVEIPLLFEAGFEIYFDKIICLTAPEKLIIKRLKERGIKKEGAKKIIKSQMDIDLKKHNSHFTVESIGTTKDLEEKVRDITKKILNK